VLSQGSLNQAIRCATLKAVLISAVALVFGSLCCFGVVLDAFQTIILPRRPKGRFRITRLFFLLTWKPWVALGDLIQSRRIRGHLYSIFGPLSLLLLLIVWAMLLSAGFGLIYFALGSPFHDALNTGHDWFSQLRTDLYVSGTSLFTLGLGDVTPLTQLARILLVLESGTGLGFVALVVGYVPVLYQAFSRREVSVAMLDGRAGSPPTAVELLRRHDYPGGEVALIQLFMEWERWAAELLESHVSYPILCYYRSQHDNQNWLSALVAILDSCALSITVVEGLPVRQAQLTFAMARHTLIDLGQTFHLDALPDLSQREPDRLPPNKFKQLCELLGGTHTRLCADENAKQRLHEIRALYEPHAFALCEYLRLTLPLWIANQSSAPSDPAAPSEGALLASEHISDQALTARLLDDEHLE
jgi:Ion channel